MSAHYHVAIGRKRDDAILVLDDGSMPGFQLTDPPPWQVVTPIVDHVRSIFGLEVVVLRAAWLSGRSGTHGPLDRLYAAVVDDEPHPAGTRWVLLRELPRRDTSLGRAIHEGALEAVDGDRQAWYRPDWLADMSAWVDARTSAAGIVRRGPVRQVRSWGRAALVTVETDRGRLWGKQVPTVFAHEIAVTGLLADIDPGIVPPLVAADAGLGRVLMEDVAGPALTGQRAGSDVWAATAARLAEIQRVIGREIDALRVAGVPTASLGQLATRVPGLLADDALLGVGQPGGLTHAEHARLQAAERDLVAACERLDRSVVGPSLEHGDLSPSQVLIGEMGPVFLDWSDSTIAHPFLAAASFLSAPGIPARSDRRFAEAYLAGWSGSAAARTFATDGAFQAAAQTDLALARVVHPIHAAVLLADRVLPGLEQPWEVAGQVPQLMHGLLPRLAALPDILRT